ncbi:MAG: histidine phosphatase family protein [Pikeienuella sp.]|uniref:histidine phosphatase family protein n=1 Tax=Pikeienuella sp. TaxID=2831957 RepID=UPI0039190A91
MKTILILALLLLSPVLARASEEAAWAALSRPGAIALMRHALAPGTGDPPNFTLGDCATQRNLDGRGREQARRAGAALLEKGVAFDRVFTSEWCRARETAELLGHGAPEPLPALNSFFGERSLGPERTEAALAALAALPEGARVMLVSHQVNVTALSGVFPASGEIVVGFLGPEGFEAAGTILIAP